MIGDISQRLLSLLFKKPKWWSLLSTVCITITNVYNAHSPREQTPITMPIQTCSINITSCLSLISHSQTPAFCHFKIFLCFLFFFIVSKDFCIFYREWWRWLWICSFCLSRWLILRWQQPKIWILLRHRDQWWQCSLQLPTLSRVLSRSFRCLLLFCGSRRGDLHEDRAYCCYVIYVTTLLVVCWNWIEWFLQPIICYSFAGGFLYQQ